MCDKRMRWALKQKLSPSEKSLLNVLAFRCDHRSLLCCPGIETLSEDTGLSRSTVIRGLKKLSANGLIKIQKHGSSSNRYTFPEYEEPV